MSKVVNNKDSKKRMVQFIQSPNSATQNTVFTETSKKPLKKIKVKKGKKQKLNDNTQNTDLSIVSQERNPIDKMEYLYQINSP